MKIKKIAVAIVDKEGKIIFQSKNLDLITGFFKGYDYANKQNGEAKK